MATVSRTTLASCLLCVLLLPMTLMVLLQGPTAPSAHAFPIDDFGDSIRLTFNPDVTTNISAAVDTGGDIHIVWEDYRSGNGDIYYVKLDAEGNKLTNDAKISNDSARSIHPTIAVDSDGHVYIVWESVTNDISELYFAKLWYYASNITFLENGLRVSDSNPANSTEPDMIVCPDGNLAMVWTDARNDIGDGNLEIYYKRLRATGTSLTTDTRITGDVGISEHPKLDIGPDGMIHIVWYDFRDSSSGLVINHGVFYRKALQDGTTVTNETRITFASPISRPDIAVDTDGNVHVVFDDDRYASFDIFYTLLDPDGNTLVDDRNISPKDDYQSRYPRISLSDSDAIDVVWQDNATGSWTVHYSAMSYIGTIEVYDQPLTTDLVGNATIPIVMCARDNNTFVLFRGDSPNQELFFQRTHRPDPCILAPDLRVSTVQPLVDSTIWVNATVRNLEGDTITDLVVALKVDSVIVQETTLASLPSGSATPVSFSYVAQEGDTSVGIAVDPYQQVREIDDDNNDMTSTITVRMLGVSVVSDATSRPANPGEDVAFNLTIMNEGSSTFSFVLSNSTLEDGWKIDLGGSPADHYTIPTTTSTIAQVIVAVPQDTLPGPRRFYIDVNCTERSSVSANMSLMIDVTKTGALSIISPSGGNVEPTIPVTYTFIVWNTANSNDSFEISATDERGWTLELSQESVDLLPEERVEMSLTVSPARYDPPGTTNMITFSIESTNLSENTAEANLLCLQGHHREVDLRITQQAYTNLSVPESREIVYVLQVQNLGNSNDTFSIGLSETSSFWMYLNTSYLFLGPGENGSLRLTMVPGTDILSGFYEFNVSAVSEADPQAYDTQEMGVNVLPYYDLHASVDHAEIHARKGNTVFVNLTIENMGNIVDVVDLYVYLDIFNTSVAVIDDLEYNLESDQLPQISLNPRDSITIMLIIPITSNASIGIYELYIDIGSLIDPSVTASENIVIIVEKAPSWLNIYVIIAIAGAAAAAGIIIFLLIRRKAVMEQKRVEDERRRRQVKRRPAGPPKRQSKTI
ncbi:MAG: hypothetical protein E4H25_00240 [Methanomassiliicoccus sp.]|nr:MAG: hypothetical protein E4H25_00240 [Methanomassiliicoccus sp.]